MEEGGVEGKTTHGWSVVDSTARVWFYEYEFSKGATSNCFVASMGRGRLLVLSPAVNLSEGAFDDLYQIGEVAAVVATNGFHHLGIASWRRRFPGARFFAPERALPRIRKKNPEAGELEPLGALASLLGSSIIVREAAHSKCGETWAIVQSASGAIWFASDILANLRSLPESLLPRLLLKWTRSAPGYRVFHLGLSFLVSDKRAVLSSFLEDLRAFPPRVVVPAHGAPIERDAAARTREIVSTALEPRRPKTPLASAAAPR